MVTGNGGEQALDSVEWEDGELLVLGTTSHRSIKSVFPGPHGAKIIRYSPVPILVTSADGQARESREGLDQYFIEPRSTAIWEPEIAADASPASHATTSETSSGRMNP